MTTKVSIGLGGTGSNSGFISVNTSTDAFRVTQTGSGNSFVVEDSTNPDSTPFIITAAGDVGIGNTAPGQKLEVEGSIRFSGDLYMRDYGKIVYYNPTSERLTIANYNANGSVVVESGGGKYSFWSDPNANIGLSGITAPTSNLHVLGNANITAGINTTTINVATGNVTANLFVAETSYSNNFVSTRTALSAPSLSGFNGEGDYVHLLIDYPPKIALSRLVNSLKGVSSRLLKKEHPRLSDIYYKGKLWSPSYFAASCGGAPLSIIQKYIENQKTPE